MRWSIVIESGANNYSAYVPDLPGCIATGQTIDEVKERLAGAIEFHLEGMRERGEAIPEPATFVDVVEIQDHAA